MDPATAIGTAAAILQFVQFSLGVLEICRQIRDDVDSATIHNKELEEAIQAAEQFRKDHAYGAQTAPSKKLAAVAQECAREAEELVDLLKHIRGAGKAKGLYRALKERRPIEKLHNRLKERERQLNHMLALDTHSKVEDVRGGVEKLAVSSQTQSDDLRQDVNRTQKSLHGHVYRSGREVRGDIARLENSSQANACATMKTVSTSRMVLQDHIDRSERKIIGEMVDSRSQADARDAKLQRTERHQQLLNTLSFPDMNQRRSDIKDAWPDTCRWIFDMDSADKSHTWANFDFWLRRSSSVYWISGKAASGKSTLMSYILSHDRTQQALREWSQGRDLCIASFYFWRPGSEMQKSVDGCLRSLLHQICTKVPTVVDAVLGLPHFGVGLALDAKSLISAIETAVAAAKDVRFCLFIDGLDEFTGRYDDLIDILFRFQQLSNIKFCVASRPETDLRFRLSKCKQLRLQDFNRSDIETFVKGRLKTADVPCTGGDTDLNKPLVDLAYKIIFAANGVFLWAAIVTQSLIQGARCGDTADMLELRLKETPKELNGLFRFMLNNIDPVHKASLAFYFLVMKLNHLFKDNWHTFANICHLTVARAPRELCSYSYHDFAEMCRQTETQILAQSAGLLEVQQDTGWMHESEEKWNASPRHFGLYPEVQISEASHDHRAKRLTIPAFPYPEFLQYELRIACWVHRSAYDFVFSSDSDIVNLICTDEKGATQRMFRGMVSYYAFAPSYEVPELPDSVTSIRLGRIHRTCEAAQGAILDGDDLEVYIKATLDESYRVTLTMAPSEFPERSRRPLYSSEDNKFHPIRAFWESCCIHGLWDRVLLLAKEAFLANSGNDLLIPCLYYALNHAQWDETDWMPPQGWLDTISWLVTRIETAFCLDARFQSDRPRAMTAYTGCWRRTIHAKEMEVSIACRPVQQESASIDGLKEPVKYSLVAQIAQLWTLRLHKIEVKLDQWRDTDSKTSDFDKDFSDSPGSVSTSASNRSGVTSASAIERSSHAVDLNHTETQDRVEDHPRAYVIQVAQGMSQTIGKLLSVLDFSVELDLLRKRMRQRPRLRILASGDLWLAWVLRRRLGTPTVLQRWQCDLEQGQVRDICSPGPAGLCMVCLPLGVDGDDACREEKGAIILNVCADIERVLLDNAKLCPDERSRRPRYSSSGGSWDTAGQPPDWPAWGNSIQFLCSQRQTQDIVRMVLDQIRNNEQLTATQQLFACACVRSDLSKLISEETWWEYRKAHGLGLAGRSPPHDSIFPRLTKDV